MKALLFLFLPFSMLAQERVDANQFLELGLKAWVEETAINDESIYFPWIDKVELRTESDEFDFERQEYSLRFSPTTPGIRKAQQSLLKHIESKGDFDLQKRYCRLKRKIHEDWLDLYLLDANINIIEELTLNISDRVTVYDRLLNAENVDFQKLIKLKTDNNDVALATYILANEMNGIRKVYSLEGIDFDFENFLTIEEVLVDVMAFSLTSPIPDSEELKYDKEKIVRELALERSERRKIFDFAQIKYQGPHDDLINERISVGLAFGLDRDGGGKLKVRELEIEKSQIEKEAENENSETLETLEALIDNIIEEYNNYQYFLKLEQKEGVELDELADKIKTLDGFNPLLLLNIGERKINTRMKRLKYEENIYKLYLDFLAETGMTCEGDRSLLTR